MFTVLPMLFSVSFSALFYRGNVGGNFFIDLPPQPQPPPASSITFHPSTGAPLSPYDPQPPAPILRRYSTRNVGAPTASAEMTAAMALSPQPPPPSSLWR